MAQLPAAVVAIVLAASTLGACTDTPTVPTGPEPTTSTAGTLPATTTSAAGTDTTPPVTPTTPTPTSPPPDPPPDPASIQALIDADYDGHDLRLGAESGSTSAYRQYYATYRGDGLTISGRINIPRGRGPFPAVVLAHGYVPIEEYTNGATMLRERDHLARNGYVTLHIDYRNHARSSRDPDNDVNLRSGYTKDAINAGLALRRHPSVDPDRLAIVGRSMGGGVVYNAIVARPGLFKAAVAYSPVSSLAGENFDHFVRRNSERARAVRDVIARLGAPEDNPASWAAASARTHFGRITEPVMIHHGTADESCPIEWSEETAAALEDAGKEVAYHVYPGERHTFTAGWALSIRRTTAFLDGNV